jgi:hypothetical protein
VNRKAQARRETRTDRERQRSSARDDLRGTGRQAGTRRTADLCSLFTVHHRWPPTSTQRNHGSRPVSTDFCNKIGTFRTSRHIRLGSVMARHAGKSPDGLGLERNGTTADRGGVRRSLFNELSIEVNLVSSLVSRPFITAKRTIADTEAASATFSRVVRLTG